MAARPLPAYDGDEAYVFVTYAHEDADLVYPHVRWLQDQGFNVWWDQGISPGAAWRAELAQAIRGCSLLVYFVTANSVVSEHCTREVHFALDEYRRPVLAVHLEKTSLPDALALSLSDRQAILRHALGPEDYEQMLVSAIATYLDQPLPEVSTHIPFRKFALRWSGWLFGLVGLFVGAVALISGRFNSPSAPLLRPISVFSLEVPGGSTLGAAGVSQALAVSRDGRRVAFIAQSANGNHLMVRRLEELMPTSIKDSSEFLYGLHYSPDGESLVFFEGGTKGGKKIPIGGGPAVRLMSATAGAGLSWAPDGTIVFSEGIFAGSRVMRISVSGGSPEPLTHPKQGEAHVYPRLLDDGSAVLWSVLDADQRERVPAIAALSLNTGQQKKLLEGYAPRMTPSGHLLFGRDNAIWAAPLDKNSLELGGEPVVVLSNVEFSDLGFPVFDVADDGSMVYQPLGERGRESQALSWMSSNGSSTGLEVRGDNVAEPRISPDGSRVAMRRGDDQTLWVFDLERSVFTRLTDDTVFSVLWHPRGERIVYTPMRGVGNLFWRNADGTGLEERLTTSARNQWASHLSGDGKELFYTECDGAYRQACDVGRVYMDGEQTAELILATKANEHHPALSPDGRWLAYESDLSGLEEVYVRPYPNLEGGRWQISSGGGKQPVWSPTGDTLYYAVGPAMGRQMMSVTIKSGQEFVPGNPKPIFTFQNAGYEQLRNHDLHPSEDRFLIASGNAKPEAEQYLVYISNWLDEVSRLVPTTR